jgi:hypothetical protein
VAFGGTGASGTGPSGSEGTGSSGGGPGAEATTPAPPTDAPVGDPGSSAAVGGAPTAPVAIARSAGPGGSRRHRSRRLAVGAVITVVVLVLLGGGIALSASSDSTDEVVVAEPPPVSDEVVEGEVPAPETDEPDAPPAPDEPDEPAGPSSTSTTTEPTTTTMPDPPVIGSLVLRPATDKPPTYPMAEAPVLSWDVSGADRVEVWLWTDGGSGPQRTRVLSSQPSGSMPICPGTVTGTRCSALAATYSFVVEAENEGGRVASTDTAPAPRFIVYTIVG